jgi:uncharacterized sulfatase
MSLPANLARVIARLARCFSTPTLFAASPSRPNIIWIVGEDTGPELGCYGDPQATTPNLDQLATQGARYTRCFTHAPVCAPSRHGLITGQYPIKTGAQHMRSTVLHPPVTFTKLLRDAGYFVLWPRKTDFNFEDPADFADTRQDWLKNEKPPQQPFFAYLNLLATHESQVWDGSEKFAERTKHLTPEQRHDPARMQLPPFWPDAPEVRRELANYYDLCTAIDHSVGNVMSWLDRMGLTENTVVIFFGDHGRGMPRYKRWCYDTGTHVPLLVRWPGQISAGSVRQELVEFVDLPATMLALGGVPRPADFDGQVFLGPETAPPRKFVHAHRDYMDEAYDRIRSVRDTRWRYVRNFAPEIPYAQRQAYLEIGKTMQAWRAAYATGKLNPVQSLFFTPTKPKEELYDTEADPYELHNVAADPAHAAKLAELRTECDEWLKKTDDKGALPVNEMISRGIIAPLPPSYEERLKSGGK